jgi:phosphoribosylanthranilate isomerase
MIVKICGIKTYEDALLSIDAGADMLGFNFYEPGPRYIPPQVCAQIVAALKEAGKAGIFVGVFVNRPPAAVLEILQTCLLDLAQLSGDESADDLASLGEVAFKAIRPTNQIASLGVFTDYAQRREPPCLLIDAHHKGMYGGTGETSDWEIARRLAVEVPILLAGGLHPGNVAMAIEEVRPWGVDVASGVESAPGIKDPAKIAAFIAASKPERTKG